jgi:hypothetical protein
MDVFLLYFSKFILSVWTFFYIYCFCQYEGKLGWLGFCVCCFFLGSHEKFRAFFTISHRFCFITFPPSVKLILLLQRRTGETSQNYSAPARVKLISILHMPFITATDETRIFLLSYSAFYSFLLLLLSLFDSQKVFVVKNHFICRMKL